MLPYRMSSYNKRFCCHFNHYCWSCCYRRYIFSHLGSIYGLTSNNVSLTDLETIKKNFLFPILIFGIIITLGGMAGGYGIKKKNACCIFLFSILVGIFIFGFLIVGIIAYFAPSIALSGNCGQDKSWVNNVQLAFS